MDDPDLVVDGEGGPAAEGDRHPAGEGLGEYVGIAYIEVDLDVGDAYILTEALAGRVTVALRRGAAFPIYDKVRVVHGIRPLAHERVVALITTPV